MIKQKQVGLFWIYIGLKFELWGVIGQTKKKLWGVQDVKDFLWKGKTRTPIRMLKKQRKNIILLGFVCFSPNFLHIQKP